MIRRNSPVLKWKLTDDVDMDWTDSSKHGKSATNDETDVAVQPTSPREGISLHSEKNDEDSDCTYFSSQSSSMDISTNKNKNDEDSDCTFFSPCTPSNDIIPGTISQEIPQCVVNDKEEIPNVPTKNASELTDNLKDGNLVSPETKGIQATGSPGSDASVSTCEASPVLLAGSRKRYKFDSMQSKKRLKQLYSKAVVPNVNNRKTKDVNKLLHKPYMTKKVSEKQARRIQYETQEALMNIRADVECIVRGGPVPSLAHIKKLLEEKTKLCNILMGLQADYPRLSQITLEEIRDVDESLESQLRGIISILNGYETAQKLRQIQQRGRSSSETSESSEEASDSETGEEEEDSEREEDSDTANSLGENSDNLSDIVCLSESCGTRDPPESDAEGDVQGCMALNDSAKCSASQESVLRRANSENDLKKNGTKCEKHVRFNLDLLEARSISSSSLKNMQGEPLSKTAFITTKKTQMQRGGRKNQKMSRSDCEQIVRNDISESMKSLQLSATLPSNSNIVNKENIPPVQGINSSENQETSQTLLQEGVAPQIIPPTVIIFAANGNRISQISGPLTAYSPLLLPAGVSHLATSLPMGPSVQASGTSTQVPRLLNAPQFITPVIPISSCKNQPGLPSSNSEMIETCPSTPSLNIPSSSTSTSFQIITHKTPACQATKPQRNVIDPGCMAGPSQLPEMKNSTSSNMHHTSQVHSSLFQENLSANASISPDIIPETQMSDPSQGPQILPSKYCPQIPQGSLKKKFAPKALAIEHPSSKGVAQSSLVYDKNLGENACLLPAVIPQTQKSDPGQGLKILPPKYCPQIPQGNAWKTTAPSDSTVAHGSNQMLVDNAPDHKSSLCENASNSPDIFPETQKSDPGQGLKILPPKYCPQIPQGNAWKTTAPSDSTVAHGSNQMLVDNAPDHKSSLCENASNSPDIFPETQKSDPGQGLKILPPKYCPQIPQGNAWKTTAPSDSTVAHGSNRMLVDNAPDHKSSLCENASNSPDIFPETQKSDPAQGLKILPPKYCPQIPQENAWKTTAPSDSTVAHGSNRMLVDNAPVHKSSLCENASNSPDIFPETQKSDPAQGLKILPPKYCPQIPQGNAWKTTAPSDSTVAHGSNRMLVDHAPIVSLCENASISSGNIPKTQKSDPSQGSQEQPAQGNPIPSVCRKDVPPHPSASSNASAHTAGANPQPQTVDTHKLPQKNQAPWRRQQDRPNPKPRVRLPMIKLPWQIEAETGVRIPEPEMPDLPVVPCRLMLSPLDFSYIRLPKDPWDVPCSTARSLRGTELNKKDQSQTHSVRSGSIKEPGDTQRTNSSVFHQNQMMPSGRDRLKTNGSEEMQFQRLSEPNVAFKGQEGTFQQQEAIPKYFNGREVFRPLPTNTNVSREVNKMAGNQNTSTSANTMKENWGVNRSFNAYL